MEAVPVQRDSPAGTEADTVHSWSTRQLNTTVRSCSVPSICSWESRAVPAPPQPSATPHCGVHRVPGAQEPAGHDMGLTLVCTVYLEVTTMGRALVAPAQRHGQLQDSCK